MYLSLSCVNLYFHTYQRLQSLLHGLTLQAYTNMHCSAVFHSDFQNVQQCCSLWRVSHKRFVHNAYKYQNTIEIQEKTSCFLPLALKYKYEVVKHTPSVRLP